MRVPSYRRHSSGQARVTLNSKDHLLGPYGSPESKEAYGRLIAEFNASAKSMSFGKNPNLLKMDDVLLSFVRHSKVYYQGSDEHYQYVLTARPIAELYGSILASEIGPPEFKAIREWWLSDKSRSRQYVNKQMKRTLRIIRWAVGEGMIQPTTVTALECIDPLKKGRCNARESKRIQPVESETVKATLPHLTQVVADMVRFQQLTGCRPGELCKIKPKMVDQSKEVWTITLSEHKTAYRGKLRTIYVGPQAIAILKPYLLRAADAFCFSPIESEKQRRQAIHEARKTPMNSGNRPGSNNARRPRKEPGNHYTAQSYGRSISYACKRAKLPQWAPNQLRHSAATSIRKEFGIDAASVILGHSDCGVTQIYAEQDQAKAILVAKAVG